MNIILGSSSPRRKILLNNIDIKFDVLIPEIDEDILKGENPLEYVTRISNKKAESVVSNIAGSAGDRQTGDGLYLIICCDTVVAYNNMILGKPKDYADAVAGLKTLSGKTHEVLSSVTLIYADAKLDITGNITDKFTGSISGLEKSLVTFKEIDEKIIKEYLNKIDYTDKAGGYAIQEYGELIIQSTKGSISNIIGFPLRLFFKMLMELKLLNKIF